MSLPDYDDEESKVIRAALVVVAVATIIALIVIVATGCGGTEPTFNPNPAESPTWDHMPLTVENLLDPVYDGSAQEAVDWWNEEVGAAVFVLKMPAPGDVDDVTLALGSASDGHLGVEYFGMAGPMRIATVEIRQPGDLCEVARILEHELGHVLGLAHDGSPPSIMSPYLDFGNLDPNADPTMQMDCFDVIYIVTDADRAAIRGRYFP